MIDLHVHSTTSDGSYTPAGLAELAKETGVEAFALTDHDTIDGTAEAEAKAKELGVGFINGMELSLFYRQRRIHVVCLGFDVNSDAFKKLYAHVRYQKEGAVPEIVEVIRQKGVDISMDMVNRYAAPRPDRYAVMRAMVGMNIFESIQYIWDKYINPAIHEVGVAQDVSAEEALASIRQAGGVTSLAHYHKLIGLRGQSRAEQEESLKELLDMGLCGMEQYYPNYTEADQAFAEAMIKKYHMLPTGGTDFHGSNRPGVLLGTGINGNMNVPMEFLTEIRKRCGRH